MAPVLAEAELEVDMSGRTFAMLGSGWSDSDSSVHFSGSDGSEGDGEGDGEAEFRAGLEFLH